MLTNKATRRLFNPLTEDFTYEWLDDSNKLWTFTIPALDTAEFPEPVARFMEKHLADKLAIKADYKPNAEDAIAKALQQIRV